MANWQFSESNQSLLERFVKTAEDQDQRTGRNKWVKKFANSKTKLLETYKFTDLQKELPTFVISSDDSSSDTLVVGEVKGYDVTGDEGQQQSNHFSQDTVETDPVSHIDYIIKKCSMNPTLYNKLAKDLSITTMEKLWDHILNSQLDAAFTEKFFTIAIPSFLKRDTSRYSIELLIKAKHHNTHMFNALLEIVIKDKDLPNNILQELASILKNNEKSELLHNIVLFDISDEVFMHHINTILIIYKECHKTKEINAFILTKLTQTAQNCCSDKIYGRLLHIYLQNQRNAPADIPALERLTDIHRSPFRKPCLNILKEMKSRSEA